MVTTATSFAAFSEATLVATPVTTCCCSSRMSRVRLTATSLWSAATITVIARKPIRRTVSVAAPCGTRNENVPLSVVVVPSVVPITWINAAGIGALSSPSMTRPVRGRSAPCACACAAGHAAKARSAVPTAALRIMNKSLCTSYPPRAGTFGVPPRASCARTGRVCCRGVRDTRPAAGVAGL